MHLKSLVLKGFKSFPERTCLDFGPGVSVVVGPNGSGKSNVTDAVLWAMGEQSPLAVRGQSMQDVIFGGGRGVQARTAAEVEIVLDNCDGMVELPLSEISIVRRLDRSGEGEYRLNGARCRLTDVLEVLSDTGLGKETHSVISQGRVEAIVTSRPRDRRLLIEEAAGLGKHRKRRRRAQLKLDRTQENLDRALDVEREARTRLRPLKRQAEAAQLHERLERQALEARLELARDDLRARALDLSGAESVAAGAREERGTLEARLQATIDGRGAAERTLAERLERDEALARGLYEARASRERLGLRREQALACAETLAARVERTEQQLVRLAADEHPEGEVTPQSEAGMAELARELEQVKAASGRELEQELQALIERAEGERAGVDALAGELEGELAARERTVQLLERAREGSVWAATWQEVRRVIEEGVRRVLSLENESERLRAAAEVAGQAEQVARGVVEFALKGVRAAEQAREQAELRVRELEQRLGDAREQHRRSEWLIEQRRQAPAHGPMALRMAQLEGELAAERRQAERREREQRERRLAAEHLRARQQRDRALLPRAHGLARALAGTLATVEVHIERIESDLAGDRQAGEQLAVKLRECAAEEAQLQAELRGAGERVTSAEVLAQRARDQHEETQAELRSIAEQLELALAEASEGDGQALDESRRGELLARAERLARRREQLGPVNPLASEEHEQALARVEELEGRRVDLETALRELRSVIRETDRQITETFEQTFEAAARNFSELVEDLFPGGSGALSLVSEAHGPRPVLGGAPLGESDAGTARAASAQAQRLGTRAGSEPEQSLQQGQHEAPAEGVREDIAEQDRVAQGAVEPEQELADQREEDLLGVEIEITPAGKSTKRLSLLSGGEKSMTALAFLFAVFLARPCPFYILDEVEAALDDLNLDRFIALLRRYCSRAQFIVITHQKRTMEAADWLYGVSMGGDGVSKVLSRRLPAEQTRIGEVAEVA